MATGAHCYVSRLLLVLLVSNLESFSIALSYHLDEVHLIITTGGNIVCHQHDCIPILVLQFEIACVPLRFQERLHFVVFLLNDEGLPS